MSVHDPDLHGGLWPQYKIEAYMEAIRPLRQSAVFAGGWAWHFMSPAGHVEHKQAHDHQYVDLVVPPRTTATALGVLYNSGFRKSAIPFDRMSSYEDSQEYEKIVSLPGRRFFRITLDFHVEDVPILQCPGGWLVVRPDVLLASTSAADACWASQEASRLLGAGRSPDSLVGWGGLARRPSSKNDRRRYA